MAPTLQADIRDWDFGELPEIMQIERRSADGRTTTLVGFPALVDRDDHCEIEVFDDPDVARAQHRNGLRRLFRLQLREQVKFLEKSLSTLQTTQMQASTVPALAAALPGFEVLRDQVVVAAIDRTCLADPWPADRAAFVARKEEARSKLSLIAQEVARLLAAIVAEAATLPKKLNASRAYAASIADIEQQLVRLFPRGFVVDVRASAACALPALPEGDRPAARKAPVRSGARRAATAGGGRAAGCPGCVKLPPARALSIRGSRSSAGCWRNCASACSRRSCARRCP